MMCKGHVDLFYDPGGKLVGERLVTDTPGATLCDTLHFGVENPCAATPIDLGCTP